MARIKCPNCGLERVVMEGKVKNCRRCGTKLPIAVEMKAPVVEENAVEKPKRQKSARKGKEND